MEKINVSTTVLLLIDVQNGFIKPGHDAVIERMRNFSERWQSAGGTIFTTRFFNNPNSPYEKFLEWGKMYDAPETEIDGRLADFSQRILDKSSYSAWTDELKGLSKGSSWETFLLGGLDTEACVMATAFDLLDAGKRPYLLTDLCASSGGEEYHDAAVKAATRGLGYQQVGESKDLQFM